MTREESIKELKRMKYPYNCKAGKLIRSNVDRENEALDMAIQALSQEPTSPCDLCRFNCKDMCCLNCPATAKGGE